MATDGPPAVSAASNAATASIGDPAKGAAVAQQIDPWSVTAGQDESGNTLEFDYFAISKQWNTTLIDDALLQRFERLTKQKPHRWLRRGLFFSHRDLNKILDRYEQGKPFMLYTGRGPSGGSMHIGHAVPFTFTKWLQDAFDVPLVIMLTDDEKFLFKDDLSVEDVKKFCWDNAKDILAFGFDERKTFMYSDFAYMGGHMYQNAVEFSRLLPFNQVRGAFGFDNSTNTGRIFFPSIQCVAAFATSYPEIWGSDSSPWAARQKGIANIPCLIPCAIDQDPYFRLLRDNAHKMKQPSPKPALIHSKFLTALQGAGGKMSSSNPNSAIFMSDTAAQIKNKINKHAFSGGGATLEEHKANGGNPDVDVAFQYLTYFLEDDAQLESMRKGYKSGEIMTGDMKKACIDLLQSYVSDFQATRTKISDDVVKSYMTPRKLTWEGNKSPNPDAGKADQQPTPTITKSSSAPEPGASKEDSDGSFAEEDDDLNIPIEKIVSRDPYTTFAPPPSHDDVNGDGGGAGGASDSLKPKRPGLTSRRTTYGVKGLSGYGDTVSNLLYPTRSKGQ